MRDLKLHGKYNWKGQPERLVFIGKVGVWNQFARVESPSEIWCEVLASDLHLLEETEEQGVGGPAPLPPIARDESMDRTYIPIAGGWEIQTKGKGSSFRICDTKSGERHLVADDHLHPFLERMAMENRAATPNVQTASDTELQIMQTVNSMCNESLPPAIHDAWELVRKCLFETRKQLKGVDYASLFPAGGENVVGTDAERLDWLEHNMYDLRCISTPTGGDDYSQHWEVISFHMAKPTERVEGYGRTTRQASDAATQAEKESDV